MKPGILCKLVKGKLLSVQKGFVDTFNWCAECWDNITAGPGLSIDGLARGRPKISVAIEQGDNVKVESHGDGKPIKISAEKTEIEAGEGVDVSDGENGAKVISVNLKERLVRFKSGESSKVVFHEEIANDADVIYIDVFYI